MGRHFVEPEETAVGSLSLCGCWGRAAEGVCLIQGRSVMGAAAEPHDTALSVLARQSVWGVWPRGEGALHKQLHSFAPQLPEPAAELRPSELGATFCNVCIVFSALVSTSAVS